MIDFARHNRPPSPVKATDKPRPPASAKAPGRLPGERVEIAIDLDPDQREATFRRLRPLVPVGRSRVTIDGASVLVEGLRPADVEPVRLALHRMVGEVAPPPPRRRIRELEVA